MSDKPFRLRTSFRDEEIKQGLYRFLNLIGRKQFDDRVKSLRAATMARPMSGRLLAEAFIVERGLAEIAGYVGGRSSDRVKRLPAASRALAETAIVAADFAAALTPEMRAVFAADLQDALEGERSLLPEWHFVNTLAWFARNGFRFWLRDDADAPLMAEIAETAVALLPVALDADAGRRVGRREWFALADLLAPLLPLATSGLAGARLIAIEFDQEPPEDLAVIIASVRDALNSNSDVTGDGWTVHIESVEDVKPGMQTEDVLKALGKSIRPGAHYAITEGEQGLLAIAAWSKAEDDVPATLCRQLEELVETSGPTVVAAFIEEISAEEWQRLSDAPGFRTALAEILTAQPEVAGLRLAHQGHLFTAPGKAPFGDIPMTLWNPADDRSTQVMRAALG
jgi:hypothetical protein